MPLAVTVHGRETAWSAQVTARYDGSAWVPDPGPVVHDSRPGRATTRALTAYRYRTRPTIACDRCGHVWRPRTVAPKKCPHCQNPPRYKRPRPQP